LTRYREGSKKVSPETTLTLLEKALLEKGAPNAFTEVTELYSKALESWKRI